VFIKDINEFEFCSPVVVSVLGSCRLRQIMRNSVLEELRTSGRKSAADRSGSTQLNSISLYYSNWGGR